MQKNVQDFTDIELKAIAFDNLVQAEQCQNVIKTINNELASRAQNTQPKKPMDEQTTPQEESESTTPEVTETTPETDETV
jgi:hypothetical protein